MKWQYSDYFFYISLFSILRVLLPPGIFVSRFYFLSRSLSLSPFIHCTITALWLAYLFIYYFAVISHFHLLEYTDGFLVMQMGIKMKKTKKIANKKKQPRFSILEWSRTRSKRDYHTDISDWHMTMPNWNWIFSAERIKSFWESFWFD